MAAIPLPCLLVLAITEKRTRLPGAAWFFCSEI